MKIIEKIKEIGIIGSGDIIGGLVASFFWFFLASQIVPEEYGQIQWILGIASIISYIGFFGGQNGLIVLIGKKIPIQSTISLITISSGMIAIFIALLIIPQFNKIEYGLITFSFIINSLVIGDFLGRKQYSKYTKFLISQKILMTILGILFYEILGVEGIIIGIGLSYLIFLNQIIRNFTKIRVNFKLIKENQNFLRDNYVMLLINGFHGQIDKLIVAPLLGFYILGNYSLALQILAIITIFPNILFKYLLSKESSNECNLNIKILGVLIAILIATFGSILLPIIFPIFFPKFDAVIEIIPVISFCAVPISISAIFESKLLNAMKSNYVLLGNILSLLLMSVGILVFGELIGIFGISMALMTSTILKCVIFFIGIKKIKY